MNPENQLTMPLPTQLNWRQRLWRQIRIATTQPDLPKPYWQTQPFAYALVFSLLVNLGLLVFTIANYKNIAPMVRFFYDAPTESVVQISKGSLIYVPIIMFIIQAILFVILNFVHKNDRRLAATVSVIIILQNAIVLLSGLQILSLSI